jgi:low temperature requirement protein LtrA
MEIILNNFSGSIFIRNCLLLITILFWVYAVDNLLKSSFEKEDKIIWLLVIIFIPIIGSLFYIFIGKKEI